jgi:hypothetical protein
MAAYHIESTVVEHKYTEVIKTENSKYLTALENLMKAEVNHKARIQERVKAAPKE